MEQALNPGYLTQSPPHEDMRGIAPTNAEHGNCPHSHMRGGRALIQEGEGQEGLVEKGS